MVLRVTIGINSFSLVLEKTSDGHQWFTEKRKSADPPCSPNKVTFEISNTSCKAIKILESFEEFVNDPSLWSTTVHFPIFQNCRFASSWNNFAVLARLLPLEINIFPSCEQVHFPAAGVTSYWPL